MVERVGSAWKDFWQFLSGKKTVSGFVLLHLAAKGVLDFLGPDGLVIVDVVGQLLAYGGLVHKGGKFVKKIKENGNV